MGSPPRRWLAFAAVVALAASFIGVWLEANLGVALAQTPPAAEMGSSGAGGAAPFPLATPIPLPRDVAPPTDRQNVVVELEIAGAITHQTEELLDAALREAAARRAQALLVVLDTPGGLLDATRGMVRRILEAPLPVITFVAPAGARAASAGLFLVLASHVAVMHPTSNIGAAHPVAAFGGDIGGSMGDKVLSDTSAWARSLAEARGRNARWAEQAVRESVSATASEAQENHVVDLLAEDVPHLLGAADGRVVAVEGRPWRLTTRGAELVRIEPTTRQRLYAALANPVLVYLLLIVGALGLFIELSSPGLIVPGVIGVLSLSVVFALQVLPMNGFALLLLGVAALLFAAEVYVTSFGLLSVAGLACLAIGSYLLFDVPGSSLRLAPSIIAATLLSVLLIIAGFGYKLIQIRRQGATSGPERFPGREARVAEAISPNGRGRVYFDGSLWNATSSSALERDQRCRVTAVEDLLLHVEPIIGDEPRAARPGAVATSRPVPIDEPRRAKPDPKR
jgi:membrane-bound serine protease (ClpP class)